MPRWLKLLSLFAALCAGILATLPWWFGWALRPLARAYGVTFSKYEPAAYSRFTLRDVRFERPAVTVSAARLEATCPLLWPWSKANTLAADDWKVMAHPGQRQTTPKSARMVSDLPSLHRLIRRIADTVTRWLPHAELRNGEISWPAQSIQLPQADWRGHELVARGARWRAVVADLTATFAENGEIRASIIESNYDLHGTLVWRDAEVSAAGTLWDQPFTAQARFPTGGWWPDEATARAETWRLPADRLKLGPHYATAFGNADLHWRKEGFGLTVSGGAEPADRSAPPLKVQIEASGDPQRITVTKADIDAPFATATLSAPVSWAFGGKLPTGPAHLDIAADLSKQPWTQRLGGKLHGTVDVNSNSRIDFRGDLEAAHFDRCSIDHATLEGNLAWPQLEFSRIKFDLDKTSSADASGRIDFAAKSADNVAVRAEIGSAWVSSWLPPKVGWKNARVIARLSGPWSALAHNGNATIDDARYESVKPLTLQASWRGTATQVDDLQLHATTNDGSSLDVSGSIGATSAGIKELSLVPHNGPPWKLESPVRLAWSPTWNIDHLQLRSAEGFVTASLTAGQDAPALTLSAENVTSELPRQWVDLPGPDWTIRKLTAATKVDDGNVAFDADLSGRVNLQPAPAEIAVKIRGDRTGVHLEQANLVEGTRAVATASGHVAARWRPKDASPWKLDGNAPLEIQARVEPDASAWAALLAPAGVVLDQPSIAARINGTLDHPQGELRFAAKRMAATGERWGNNLPEIGELSLLARASRDELVVDSLSAKIDGQLAAGHARVSLSDDKWRELFTDPLPYLWRSGEGQFSLDDFDLAPLSRRFPRLLAAQGRLNARVSLAAGSRLSGDLRVQDAATRPIAPFGVFQGINAEMALADRTLNIRSWSAVLGGQPVTLAGTVTLPLKGPPQLALTLKGENVPLLRRAGLLVRSDLDLRAETDRSNSTKISGTVNLRDCIVLADLAALVPSGPRTVAQQPPYFSVDIPPFERWPLAVDIGGRRAVRVNTAVFKGVATPRFHLGGTLGQPRAVGDVTVDEGRVFFPFATFTVQFASVRLSEADPYHPQLVLNATSRYHDYQLRLEGSGPVETPNITFSSIPALETAQVLLMVTSGQVPETDSGALSGSQRLTQLGTYLGQGLLQGTSGDSRLEITAGERVSRQGRETYEFTYRLDDRWSLVGEYDEYDEYNAGVKWRAYTQQGDAPKRK